LVRQAHQLGRFPVSRKPFPPRRRHGDALFPGDDKVFGIPGQDSSFILIKKIQRPDKSPDFPILIVQRQFPADLYTPRLAVGRYNKITLRAIRTGKIIYIRSSSTQGIVHHVFKQRAKIPAERKSTCFDNPRIDYVQFFERQALRLASK
jgi:hypothetical protein